MQSCFFLWESSLVRHGWPYVASWKRSSFHTERWRVRWDSGICPLVADRPCYSAPQEDDSNIIHICFKALNLWVLLWILWNSSTAWEAEKPWHGLNPQDKSASLSTRLQADPSAQLIYFRRPAFLARKWHWHQAPIVLPICLLEVWNKMRSSLYTIRATESSWSKTKPLIDCKVPGSILLCAQSHATQERIILQRRRQAGKRALCVALCLPLLVGKFKTYLKGKSDIASQSYGCQQENSWSSLWSILHYNSLSHCLLSTKR